MKTQYEVCTEFLENLIIKSDDELLAILNQDFTAEDYGDEGAIYNLDTLAEIASLFDLSDNNNCGFQVLAVLCATNKEKSFKRIQNHYEQGSFKGIVYFNNGGKINKAPSNKNFAFNIAFNKISFEIMQNHLKVLGDTIWIEISKDKFSYGWNDALGNSGASISECSSSESEHCSESPDKVTLAIPLEALKDEPIEDNDL